MAGATWVYRKSDGLFLRGGLYEPTVDPATEGVADMGERHPDPRTERFDALSPTKTRPATQPEIDAVDQQRKDDTVAGLPPELEMLVRWCAQHFGVTRAQALAELRTIRRQLS